MVTDDVVVTEDTGGAPVKDTGNAVVKDTVTDDVVTEDATLIVDVDIPVSEGSSFLQ